MPDIKYRNVSNKSLNKNSYIALLALDDYGYKGSMTITGMKRNSSKNSNVGGVKNSKHLDGEAIDISAKKDSSEFINWVNSNKGRKWANDFNIKALDETDRDSGAHYHIEFNKPTKNNIKNYDKYLDKYHNNRDIDSGLVDTNKKNSFMIDDKNPISKGKNNRHEKSLKFINENYNKDKKEVDYLREVYGGSQKTNPEKYKEFKEKEKKLNERAFAYLNQSQRNKEEDLKNQINEAENSGNYEKAIELRKEKKEFDKSRYSFEKKQKTSISKGGSRTVVGGSSSEGDYDYDAIHKIVQSRIPEDNIENEEENENIENERESVFQKYNGNNRGGGSGSFFKRSQEIIPDVNDLEFNDDQPKDVNDIVIDGEEVDWDSKLSDAEKKYNDYKDFDKKVFDDSYAPDSKNDSDLLGSIMDISRGAIGLNGAREEIPIYERGAIFQEALADSRGRKETGLTQEEIGYRKKMAERGHAYDVKNIRRLSGGNAGVALGNLGRAATGLQDEYSKIAAVDESTRRINRKDFQNMALRDESINRQIFEDELHQTTLNKQSGSALVQDAIRNIQERGDYNKQYGKGSSYYEYEKSKVLDSRKRLFDIEEGNRKRVYDYEKELENDLIEARRGRDKKYELETSK